MTLSKRLFSRSNLGTTSRSTFDLPSAHHSCTHEMRNSSSRFSTGIGNSAKIARFGPGVRIPTKADTDSNNWRTPIPIESGQFRHFFAGSFLGFGVVSIKPASRAFALRIDSPLSSSR